MRTLDELGISPAPWDYQPNNPQGITVACHGNSTICCLPNNSDARLIASAPSLYEALCGLVDFIDRECVPCGENACELMTIAHAALAAASGESEEAK